LETCFGRDIELPGAYEASFVLDVMLVFRAEQFDTAGDGTGGGIAQWAEGLATDVIANVHKQIDVAWSAVSMFNTMENFHQPVGAFATGSTFAAGFVAIEFGHAQNGIYDACVIVHDDDATGAKH
jgi:hypothetical protein